MGSWQRTGGLAMVELQSVVAESSGAQLVFGAMGFPVMMGVLREECDDVEMVWFCFLHQESSILLAQFFLIHQA
ncbi:PREDICTED: golgin candidate 6-like isoform 1 [Fragaria vesca subsp. vesca]